MFKKLQLNWSSLFGLLLFALSVWVMSRELQEYNYRHLLDSLATIPKRRLSESIWLTVIGYLVMVPYDILGLSYANCSLNWKRIALTNFISSVFSNTIGMALLTGSAIRYRFYSSWGVPPWAIAQAIAFVNFTFWLGMFALAGLIFLINPLAIPPQLHLPFVSVRPIGIIFLLLIIVYLLASLLLRKPLRIGSQEFRFPNFKISIVQIIISSFDWLLAAAVVYVLLPSHLSISYGNFLEIYLLAMFAGVVSNIPGGLGVFETVILLILSSEVSAVSIFSSLLAYRVVYYFFPLIVATAALGLYELKHGTKNITGKM